MSSERAWEAPAKLQEVIQSGIMGRLEKVRAAEREQREIVSADLARRNLGKSPSGADMLLKALQPEFDAYANGVVDDMLSRVKEVYGRIPPEAIPWLRRTFEERVVAAAPRLAARGGLLAEVSYSGAPRNTTR
jgi:hypothetical protein